MLHIPSKPPQFRSADLLQNYPLFTSNAGFNLIEGPSNETLVQEIAEACEVSSRRATKRGRPKSERKKLDGELFKRLLADSSAEVDRYDFQQIKFEKFKKGQYSKKAFVLL